MFDINLLLKGGLVYSEESKTFISGDVRVVEDKIAEIGEGLVAFEGEEVVDCSGKHVLPGLIDVHVHFREPGATHKEDWLSGSKAAVSGGVTTVFDMPNTKPPTVTQVELDQKRGFAGEKSLINYGCYILGCKENPKDVGKFVGVPGVKVYLGSSTGNYLTDDLGVFAQILESLKPVKYPVVVHCENEYLLKYFFEKHKETGMHHKMRENVCAAVSVAESSVMANYFGKQLHVAHMTTKEEVDFLRKNKTEGISCEVCPHHLFLTESYFCKHGNFGKMNPPLRYQKDQEALWQGIKEGIIDIVSTDHAPHTIEEKSQDFEKGPCGVPGVQTMLTMLLKAVSEGKISLADVVKLCCTNPARIFHVKDRGRLSVGCYADICVVDLEKEKMIRNDEQQSKCGWTPFDGLTVKGWPVMTIVNGTIAYDDGNIIEGAHGKEVEFLH